MSEDAGIQQALRASDGRRPPRKLPRGAHGIPRELVARNQRERMIAALAEVVSEHSYRETAVAQVVEWAGVSRATFYQQFDDLLDCMLSAFSAVFERLFEEIERACAEVEKTAGVQVALRRALELLAADPPSARLLTVEIVAAGPQGVRAQHAAFTRLAELLKSARGDGSAALASPSSVNPEWGLVALVSTLIANRVTNGEAERLAALEDELSALAPLTLATALAAPD